MTFIQYIQVTRTTSDIQAKGSEMYKIMIKLCSYTFTSI